MGFFGKSNTFPMIGYPFGPGGYEVVRLKVHCLRNTARVTTVATTASAGPTYFSDMDMGGGGERGIAGDSEGPGLPVLSSHT